jgi:hypothetical protein
MEPREYWNNKENCQKEALKYNTKFEFLKNNKYVYNFSYKRGWLDDICSHMIIKYKPNGYWTKEKCGEEALKYSNRTDFQKNSASAYIIARNNIWIDEICLHMIQNFKPKNYWSFKNCLEEALNYNNRIDFQKAKNGAYDAAFRNNWLDEICGHMLEFRKPSGYWNDFNNIKNEALKYDNKTDFKEKSASAYGGALRNKWVDEICSHMSPRIPKYNNEKYKKWIIYCYIIYNKFVYVGVSDNLQRRHYEHIKKIRCNNDSLNNKIIEEKIDVENLIKITSNKIKNDDIVIDTIFNVINYNSNIIELVIEEKDILTRYNASKLESYYLDKRIKDGYIKLNVVKTGSVGGSVKKWNYENSKEEALKYKTRAEFERYSKGAYLSAMRSNWLNDICYHMIEQHKPNGYWNYDRCKEIALKYNKRSHFQKEASRAYTVSRKNNWLDEFFPKKIIIYKF